MKVVKVDGTVFLAEVDGTMVSNAMSVGKGSITDDYRGKMAEYVMTQNMDKLIEMNIGSHSAVATRELNAEEEVTLDTAYRNMEISRSQAVRNLENEYFKANF